MSSEVRPSTQPSAAEAPTGSSADLTPAAAAPVTVASRADTRTKRQFDRSIVEGPLPAAVWKMAWPTVLQNMIGGLQGILDHAMVGHYVGFTGNAAIGVSWQIFLVVIVFISSLFTGMSVLVARFAGAGDDLASLFEYEQSVGLGTGGAGEGAHQRSDRGWCEVVVVVPGGVDEVGDRGEVGGGRRADGPAGPQVEVRLTMSEEHAAMWHAMERLYPRAGLDGSLLRFLCAALHEAWPADPDDVRQHEPRDRRKPGRRFPEGGDFRPVLDHPGHLHQPICGAKLRRGDTAGLLRDPFEHLRQTFEAHQRDRGPLHANPSSRRSRDDAGDGFFVTAIDELDPAAEPGVLDRRLRAG